MALWSGEEQGLLGLLAYVKEHLGTAENPKPAFSKFGGYYNIDSGTGRVRGATVFGPAEAATIRRGTRTVQRPRRGRSNDDAKSAPRRVGSHRVQ